MRKRPLSKCEQAQKAFMDCRELLKKEQDRCATTEALLEEARQALGQGAAALRKGASDLRVQTMTAGGEPHWLVKDFNVLYASAHALAEACSGRGDGRPHAPLKALEAQLERLKPAFADTQEVQRLMRERQGS